VRRNELEIGAFSFKLSEFRRVLVIGGGKAAAGMALEIERILDAWITGGSVNIPDYTRPWPKCKKIKFNPASHPIPSDDGVGGDKLESIASGPTVPDDTTYADAYTILQEHGLWRTVPSSVRKRIQKGKEGKLSETPKRSSRILKRVHNVLVGTNEESCQAA